MKRLIAKLSDALFLKMKKKKAEDGCGSESWTVWFSHLFGDLRLQDTMADQIHKNTVKTFRKLWMQNFASNLPVILEGKSIRELVPEKNEGPAIVVGAGPSVWSHKHLDLLAENGFEGVVVSTDRMLIPCLEKGVIPNYVVSVDGNRDLIVKWYDHPLVDKCGSAIRAVLLTQVAPNVVKRCLKAGLQVYWYHSIGNDKELMTNMLLMTASERNPDGMAAMGTGGNAGTACWFLAWTILKRSPVALIGMDFGYPDGTKLEETPYYSAYLQMDKNPVVASVKVRQYYQKVFHPVFGTEAWIDPAFRGYRDYLYNVLWTTEPWLTTINCTEGGTLVGPVGFKRFRNMRFRDFLNRKQ